MAIKIKYEVKGLSKIAPIVNQMSKKKTMTRRELEKASKELKDLISVLQRAILLNRKRVSGGK